MKFIITDIHPESIHYQNRKNIIGCETDDISGTEVFNKDGYVGCNVVLSGNIFHTFIAYAKVQEADYL
jgi:hypothetical protein